jgi:hypothetical protein
MKHAALFLVLALSFPLGAQTPDAAKRAKVQEFLGLLHMDRTMKQMMNGMRQQVSTMTSQMIGDHATAQQKAQLARFQNQVFDFVNTRMGWKSMEPEYVELYAETFSDEELDGIIAFYKTPAGVSMIAKTPELTQKSLAISQKKMAEVMPDLQKMIQDFAASTANQKTPAVQSN